jgi:hypothetical protein
MQTTWADRLFGRLAAIYGHPKLASMWPADDLEVRQAWEEQLRRFTPDVLRQALQAIVDSGREWPPTLPEFVATARQFIRPEHAPISLPAPSATEMAAAAQQIQAIAGAVTRQPGWDHLDWARRPRSVYAWVFLQRGAESDPRLRDIVRHHIATQGRDCLCEVARKAVIAAGAAQPEAA